ncbi:MAG: hypothetical protein HY064_15925 [Bacteroidetes bacterium]|nr:hypothetical protein [Bacteroidota bacterium]
MKKVLLCSVFATSIFFAFSCGSAADKAKADSTTKADSIGKLSNFTDPDAFATEIVTALSKNDFTAFSRLVINKEEMIALMNSSKDQSDKDMVSHADEMMKDITENSKKTFDEVRDAGTKDGIDWSQAKFKKGEYDRKDQGGFESMAMKMVIDCKGKEYHLAIDKTAKAKTGWRIVGRMDYGDQDMAGMIQSMMDSINNPDMK